MRNRQFKVITLLLLLIIMVIEIGFTFAYFLPNVFGNKQASDDLIAAANYQLSYDGTSAIDLSNIEPGDSMSKTFTVTNSGSKEISQYTINFSYITNTFSIPSEITYTISCSSSSGNCDGVSETAFPTSSSTILIQNAISVNEKHTYTIILKFKETNSGQDYNQGKYIRFRITVNELKDYFVKSMVDNYSTYGLTQITHAATGKQNYEVTDYLYQGLNPHNYVTFNGQLWRIIGVVKVYGTATGIAESRLKLVKDSSIGNLDWNQTLTGTNYNDWANSTLKNLLNTGAYYNSTTGTTNTLCSSHNISNCDYSTIGLNTTAKNMIDEVKWYLGNVDSGKTTAETYILERSGIVTSGNSETSVGKVGLLYPSDYGYASSSCYNTSTTLDAYNSPTCTGSNWLYSGISTWTISPFKWWASGGIIIDSSGVTNNTNVASSELAVKPVVYLKTNVEIKSGTGTSTDPYQIGI